MPSQPFVSMQVIKPAKTLSSKKLSGKILAALHNKAKPMLREYLDMTTETWEHEKPAWDIGYTFAGGDIQLVGEPRQDGSLGTRKWHWLNQGTQVRHAIMSRDWRSKTKRGRVRARAGQGQVLYVSKKFRMPGIEARRWYYYIPKLAKKKFARIINQAVKEGLQK